MFRIIVIIINEHNNNKKMIIKLDNPTVLRKMVFNNIIK